MKSVFTFFTGTETAQFSALGVSPDCGGIWDIYGVCRIYEGTQSGRPILHTAGNGWNRKISLKFLLYYKWLYPTIPSFVYHPIFFISFFSSGNLYVYFYPSWLIFSLHIDQILNEATFVNSRHWQYIADNIWYLFRVGTAILTSEVGVALPFTFWRWSLPEK